MLLSIATKIVTHQRSNTSGSSVRLNIKNTEFFLLLCLHMHTHTHLTGNHYHNVPLTDSKGSPFILPAPS